MQYHSYRSIQEDLKVPHQKRRRPEGRYCYLFYARNFIKNYWIDPDSEEVDKEFDASTLSEQGFSIGKGSLNLGIEWATLHSCCVVYLYGDVTGGKDSYRNRATRPCKVCEILPGVIFTAPLYIQSIKDTRDIYKKINDVEEFSSGRISSNILEVYVDFHLIMNLDV
jgi:hypothetical protein